MRRGIVIDRGEREAILLTPSGEFLRVTAVEPEWTVGQEVTFAWPEPAAITARRRPGRWSRYPVWGLAAAVAAVVLMVASQGVLPALRPAPIPPVAQNDVGGPGGNAGNVEPSAANGGTVDPPPPTRVDPEKLVVAYVTMDINPSVELGVGVDGRVLTVRPLNEDGERLVDRIEVVGLTAEEAVERLMEAAVAKGYLAAEKPNAVVIAATPAPAPPPAPDANGPPGGTISADELARLVARLERTLPPEARKVTERRHIPGQVVAFAAPAQAREVAEREGISVGRLLFVVRAKEEGVRIDLEEVRRNALGEAIRRAGGNPQQLLGGLSEFARDPKLKAAVEKFEAELRRTHPERNVKPRPVRIPGVEDDADRDERRPGLPPRGGDVRPPNRLPGGPGLRPPAPRRPGTLPAEPGAPEAQDRPGKDDRPGEDKEKEKDKDRPARSEERDRDGDRRGARGDGLARGGGEVPAEVSGDGTAEEWEAFLRWLKRLRAGGGR